MSISVPFEVVTTRLIEDLWVKRPYVGWNHMPCTFNTMRRGLSYSGANVSALTKTILYVDCISGCWSLVGMMPIDSYFPQPDVTINTNNDATASKITFRFEYFFGRVRAHTTIIHVDDGSKVDDNLEYNRSVAIYLGLEDGEHYLWMPSLPCIKQFILQYIIRNSGCIEPSCCLSHWIFPITGVPSNG